MVEATQERALPAEQTATDVNPAIAAQLERTARVQGIINAILSSPSLAQIQRALSDTEISHAALTDSGSAQLRGLLEAAGMSEQAKEIQALQIAGTPLTPEERTLIVDSIKNAPAAAADTSQTVTACATVENGVPSAGALAINADGTVPSAAVVAGSGSITPEKVDVAAAAVVPVPTTQQPTTEATKAQVDASVEKLFADSEHVPSGHTERVTTEQAAVQPVGAVR